MLRLPPLLFAISVAILTAASGPAGLRPPAALAQAKQAPLPIKTEASKVSRCGFVELQGLPFNEPSIKCEVKTRATDVHLTVDSVTFSGAWPNGWISVLAEKSNSRNGFRPMHSEDLKKQAERFAGPNASNWSAMIGSPFRHFRFSSVLSGRDYACLYGIASGGGGTPSGGDRQYAFIGFCQPGIGGVPDENVSAINSAMVFK